MASGATVVANVSNLTYNGGVPSAAFAPWYVSGTIYSGSGGVCQTLGNVTLGGGTLTGSSGAGSGYGNYSAVGGSYTTITSSGNSLINAPSGLSLQGATALGINVVNPGDVLTISAVIFNITGGGNTAGITLSGSGTLVLSATNTFTGATTINGGTLQLGDGVANNGSVAGGVADNAVLTFANPNAQSYGGTISGGGALIKTGTGGLTFTTGASPTYTGPTTVSAGTLTTYKSLDTSLLTVASSGAYYANVTNSTYNGSALAPGMSTARSIRAPPSRRAWPISPSAAARSTALPLDRAATAIIRSTGRRSRSPAAATR